MQTMQQSRDLKIRPPPKKQTLLKKTSYEKKNKWINACGAEKYLAECLNTLTKQLWCLGIDG